MKLRLIKSGAMKHCIGYIGHIKV